MIKKFRYYKKIVQSNLGRNYDWNVELNGQLIAILIQYSRSKLFRNSYLLEVKDSLYEKDLNANTENWYKFNITYVSSVFPEFRIKNTDTIGPRIDFDIKTQRNIFEYRMLHYIPKFKNKFEEYLFKIVMLIYEKYPQIGDDGKIINTQ